MNAVGIFFRYFCMIFTNWIHTDTYSLKIDISPTEDAGSRTIQLFTDYLQIIFQAADSGSTIWNYRQNLIVRGEAKE